MQDGGRDSWAGASAVWPAAADVDGHGDRDPGADPAPADDLASLFAATPPHEAGPGRRRGTYAVVAMAVLAVALVALAAAAVLAPQPPAGTERPPAGTERPPAGTERPPAGTDQPPAGSRSAPVANDDAGHSSSADSRAGATGDDAAARVAVQAVRVARSATPRHVLDAAAVRRTELGELTVVTVEAVAVHAQAGTWGAPQRLRFAVPVRTADAAVVGAPWPLPPPTSGNAELAWEPVVDGERAAAIREGLLAAGFTDLPDDAAAVALSRSPAVPGVVRAQVRAVAPGAMGLDQHQVWFHDDERPALLGAEGGRP